MCYRGTLSFTKGGYNLASISESMAACTHSLLGDPPSQLTSLRPPQPGALASISEAIQVHRKYWRSLRLMKMEDKEECSSSRLVIKKLPPTASPVSAKGVTTPKGKVPELSMQKIIATPPAKESPLGQAKSKTAKAVLAQGQSSEQAAKGTTMDLATSKETEGGATVNQCASAAATENLAKQTTSEEAVGGTRPTPPASYASKPSMETSPLQGATAPQSLEFGFLRTLELSSEAQEAYESEEGLLGEAAGGQDMNSLMLTQGFGDSNTQEVFYAVTPLSWCPHLVAVRPIPAAGLNVSQPCKTCGTFQENWVCLTCYQVYCSRYVNTHMVCHHEASEHPLVLSCVDLSTWCYLCQAYVHHEDLQDVKNAAHQNKFGENMPHSH